MAAAACGRRSRSTPRPASSICRSAIPRRTSTASSGPAPISTPISLVALDAKTGKLLWYRQFIPHDVHDADLSQVSPLFETTIDGKKHDVISVSGKDGLLRLLDRDNHDQFYEVPITTRENVDAMPTVEGVHRCPGLLGGMEWNGPAYDPGSNSLFVPAVDWCGIFSKAPKDPPIMQGMHYYGGAVASDPREKSKGLAHGVRRLDR